MVNIGRYNNLRVIKAVEFGMYLDGGEDENGRPLEILLPLRYVPENGKPEDWLDVFIYLDSEDRIIATTEKPFAQVGDFACLQVISVNSIGAFLDWGLMKDLLVPFREQKIRMQEGGQYIVYIYEDTETSRIVASAKIDKFLNKATPSFSNWEQVNLMITQRTDLGYKAIVNNEFGGILYENEVFQRLGVGEKMVGYIKQIRDDNKIDLILHKPGYGKVENIAENILEKLKESGGFIAVTDKSDAEIIYELFGVSKKSYKKAVGELYKKRSIVLSDQGIHLATS